MDSTVWLSFFGGLLIGLSVVALYVGTGKIAGISGIAGQLTAGRWSGWGGAFLVGLPLGGLLHRILVSGIGEIRIDAAWPRLCLAGLLVGFGTRLANGCTSGHGICGLGRLSPRSLAATGAFMLAGMLTVLVAGRGL